MPRATGHRINVIIPKVVAKSQGGIIIPESRVAEEELAATVCYVAQVGPDAYADKTAYPSGPWCKEGDWILIGKYNGTRFYVTDKDGTEWQVRTINDNTVLDVVPDPNAIKRNSDGIAYG